MQDIMKKILSNTKKSYNFVTFFGEYNKYRAEIFSVYLYFNKLSIDISHFVIA